MLELTKCEALDYGRERHDEAKVLLSQMAIGSQLFDVGERGVGSSMRLQRLEHGSSLHVEMGSVPDRLSIL